MAIRIILALVLLSIVVAVSYIKSVRGNSATERGEQTGNGQIMQTSDAVPIEPNQLAEYEDNVDSLRSLIDKLDHSYAESLAQKDLEHGRRVDSLFDVLDSVECELDSHHLILSEMPISDEEVFETDFHDDLAAQNSRRDEVIEFYKKQFTDLPGDLTAYERKVSLYEIRLETAKKFQLTLTELKQMREEDGLTY